MERPGAPERKALEKAAAAANGAGLPEGGEYYYLKNFQGFKQRVDSFKDRLQHLLTSLPAAAAVPPPTDAFGDVDEAGDWVTSLLDVTLEAVDDALADAKRAGEAAAASAAPQPWLPPGAGAGAGPASAATTKASPAGAAAGRGRGGGDGFVSYMESQLQRRPQESFDDPVDNSRAPFVHRLDSLAEVVDVEVAAAAAAAAAAAGEAPPHPLADRLAALQYPGWQLEAGEARPPKDLEETPFTYIDTLPALRAAAERLAAAKEVAIDLEAHNYRSFQGFCCLMQLSTRSEDIVVDTLALRPHIGPALAAVFADPSVVKVLHGADSDVVWLQRDFGLYLCNMFDTGQAARVLEFKGLGLAYLLDFYCSFKADKRFQLADWRVRPLTSEMLHYARCDTHYLLYCYDRLRAALLEAGDAVPEGLDVELQAGAQAAAAGGRGALATVLERSRRLCLQGYEKEAFTPLSFMELLSKLNATLTDAQLSVFAALYEWRDRVCRELDESTGYVLPRAQLLKLAQALPRTVADIHKAVGRSSPVVSRRSGEVLAAIQAAQQPEAVAAARELRQRPWKQALEEQQQQARGAQQQAEPAAAGDAAAPGQQQQAQPVQQEVAAVEDARPKPTLKPRVIKPLAAPTAGGSLLAALASAPTAAKPLLQPRTVRPLTTGSSMLGAAPVSSCTAAVPQQPGTGVAAGGAVPAATAAAAAAEAEQMATEPAAAPEAAQGGAPVAAEEAAPADSALPRRRLTPAGLQQKTAMLGGSLGNGAASGQQRHGPPLLGRGAASSVGSLLGTAAGGQGSAMAAAAAAVKASFALPFALAAAAPAADAAVERGPAGALAPAVQAQQQQQAAASVQADAASAGQSRDAQRDAIRAAVDAMQREDNQGGGSNQGEHGHQQQQQQQQQQQGRGGQGAAGSSPLEEFMPLPVSAQFGKGAVKRRQPQERQPAGVTKQVRRQRDTEQHLKRTMVELGLEDASSSGESDSEPEGAPAGKRRRPQQREQQPAKRAGAARQAQQAGSSGGAAPVGETEAASAGAGKRVDYAAAKDKFNLGIVNPHALPPGEAQNPRRQGGRGRGRGGRSGGRGGRGGRGRDEDAPRMPPGKFNPYAAPEVNALKAGKRSAVHVRSGNRSMTFRD